MSKGYIALGTNIGDTVNNIKKAVEALDLLPFTSVLKQSKLYETDPWGYENQCCFLNAVVLVETQLSAAALLGGLLGIEAAMGRVRSIKNGPRIIDLDLLMFDDLVINTQELVLPHPGLMQRAFVLRPLCDICDDDVLKNALSAVDQSGVRKYEA